MVKFILWIAHLALNIGIGGAADHYFGITQFVIIVIEKTLNIFDMNDVWAKWIIIIWLGLIITFISDKIGFSKWIYHCICVFLKRYKKEKTETISEKNINFSSITPYCRIKHAVPSIGLIIEIINSSAEMIYCSVNSEVTFLKINDRINEQKLISSNIKVLSYCPKSSNSDNQNSQLATKSDLANLEIRLESEIKLVRSDLSNLEHKFDSEIKAVNTNIKWIMAIGMVIIGLLVKLTFAV